MIIPIKCFTCGKVLADKWLYYKKQVEKEIKDNNIIYLDGKRVEKSVQGKVLDRLNLKKICCRRHMLTHVDIE
tara:strand:- start:340 stop:558 length:219 start_codon:yes stop_codon:yes gene_type:complete